jgi:hypothetical protein
MPSPPGAAARAANTKNDNARAAAVGRARLAEICARPDVPLALRCAWCEWCGDSLDAQRMHRATHTEHPPSCVRELAG